MRFSHFSIEFSWGFTLPKGGHGLAKIPEEKVKSSKKNVMKPKVSHPTSFLE